MSRSYNSMRNIETFGALLRNLRQEAKMPLRKLAALLDMDQSTLSKIERGERRGNIEMIKKIAKIFNVDIEQLVIAFYSDMVVYEIQNEKTFYEILQVAEDKIEYQRRQKKM